MIQSILFPTDWSAGADRVFDHVCQLASRHDATLHIVHVSPEEPRRRPKTNDVDELLEDAVERADKAGVDAVSAVVNGEPYLEILDYATTHDIGLIAMPTHGRRGLRRLLLGSTTDRVLRLSDVPVLTVRPDSVDELAAPYRTVLVPTDGSECADAALILGVDLARTDDADLHVLSVVDTSLLGADITADIEINLIDSNAHDVVHDAVELARDAGVDSVTGTVESETSVHRAITAFIDDHDVDVVVVGTHGRTGIDRYLLGNVAEKLFRTSPVPVLTVRAPLDE
ncbi:MULTISPECIES: universal stress protein [Haloferax]|uniref:Universal stress protein n=2 Tax=Haloferax TaxID=2251 RepID=A0A6G1YY12_9EURY|nr:MULTISPECIES: universal stress protein [Haloferax]KAB1186612.1 universal stress protein [Haloferax sp. CBA1149]MRW79229.1 universal stress protein [Haloferax marinisediminis]